VTSAGRLSRCRLHVIVYTYTTQLLLIVFLISFEILLTWHRFFFEAVSGMCNGVVFPGPASRGFLKDLKVFVSSGFSNNIYLSVCSTVGLDDDVDSVLDKLITVCILWVNALQYIFLLDLSNGYRFSTYCQLYAKVISVFYLFEYSFPMSKRHFSFYRWRLGSSWKRLRVCSASGSSVV
jgi:hypothetical protein